MLGVSPMELIDSIINAVNDFVADGVDAMESALKQKNELKAQHRVIEESSDKLMHLMTQHVDVNFDKFELYAANNVFKLPDGVEADEAMDDNGEDSILPEADLVSGQIVEATRRHAELRARRAIVAGHHRAALHAKGQLEQMHAHFHNGGDAGGQVSEMRVTFAKLKQVSAGVQQEARQVSAAGSSHGNFEGATRAVGSSGTSESALLHNTIRK